MKALTYTRTAIKALRRMPVQEAARVMSKIEQYAGDPAAQANNVKKLQGRPGFRLRVGDWRVIFDESGTVIDVLDVGPRGGIYDWDRAR